MTKTTLTNLATLKLARMPGTTAFYISECGRFVVCRDRFRESAGRGSARWATGWVVTNHFTGRAVGPTRHWSSLDAALGALAKFISKETMT